MSGGGDATIRALRAAAEVSPDNLPLRTHLADTLLALGQLADAEHEYKAAISRWAKEPGLKVGLAKCYLAQGRAGHAVVVLEGLSEEGAMTPHWRVLLARALARAGETPRAARQYRMAIDADPGVADPVLGDELGVTAGSATAGDDEDRARTALGADGDPVDFGASDESWGDAERPDLSFADVGGMERVKEEIRVKIILPMERPELYKAYGKKAGGGILLYGPPGCGKTHLARATAGEVKARFMSVGVSDVLNMWMGESERSLHQLFERARASAPCVIFFDEVDALGASRSDMRHSSGRHLVNQFLSELDGAGAPNEGVLVLAATNAPWHVDHAFRRPGRFDRVVFVPPPDAPARGAILRILLKGKPSDQVDVDALVKKTDGFSGADLRATVDQAIEEKLRAAARGGGIEPLRTKDLLHAAKSIKPSTKEWFASARNHALYANEAGLYDEVLDYLKLR